MPIESVEAMHWAIGKTEMALRAKAVLTNSKPSPASSSVKPTDNNIAGRLEPKEELPQRSSTLFQTLEDRRTHHSDATKPPQTPPSHPERLPDLENLFKPYSSAAGARKAVTEAKSYYVCPFHVAANPTGNTALPINNPMLESTMGIDSSHFRSGTQNPLMYPAREPGPDTIFKKVFSTAEAQPKIAEVAKGLSGQKSLDLALPSTASLTVEGKRQARAAGDKLRARTSPSRHRRGLMAANDHASHQNRWAEYKTPGSIFPPKASTEQSQDFSGPSLTSEGKRQAQVAGDKLRLRTNPIRHSRPSRGSVSDHGINKNRWSSYGGARVTRFDERPDAKPENKKEPQFAAYQAEPSKQPSLLEVFETELAKKIFDADSKKIKAAELVPEVDVVHMSTTQPAPQAAASESAAAPSQGSPLPQRINPLMDGLKIINEHLQGLTVGNEGPSQEISNVIGNGVRTAFGGLNSFLQSISGGMHEASNLTLQAADRTCEFHGGLIEDAATQFANIEKGVAALAKGFDSICHETIDSIEAEASPAATTSELARKRNLEDGVSTVPADKVAPALSSIHTTSKVISNAQAVSTTPGRFEVPEESDDEEDDSRSFSSNKSVAGSAAAVSQNTAASAEPNGQPPGPTYSSASISASREALMREVPPQPIYSSASISASQAALMREVPPQLIYSSAPISTSRAALVHVREGRPQPKACPMELGNGAEGGRSMMLPPVATRFPTLAQFEGQNFAPKSPFPPLPSMRMEPLVPERAIPPSAPRILLKKPQSRLDAMQIAQDQQKKQSPAIKARNLLKLNGINPSNLSDTQFDAFLQQDPAVQQKSIQVYAQNLAKNQRKQQPSTTGGVWYPGRSTDNVMPATSNGVAKPPEFHSGSERVAMQMGGAPVSTSKTDCGPLQDYQMQLNLLEQQNMRRRFMAQQQQERLGIKPENAGLTVTERTNLPGQSSYSDDNKREKGSAAKTQDVSPVEDSVKRSMEREQQKKKQSVRAQEEQDPNGSVAPHYSRGLWLNPVQQISEGIDPRQSYNSAGANHALQDYQTQVMLLKRQSQSFERQKDKEQMTNRQEQDTATKDGQAPKLQIPGAPKLQTAVPRSLSAYEGETVMKGQREMDDRLLFPQLEVAQRQIEAQQQAQQQVQHCQAQQQARLQELARRRREQQQDKPAQQELAIGQQQFHNAQRQRQQVVQQQQARQRQAQQLQASQQQVQQLRAQQQQAQAQAQAQAQQQESQALRLAHNRQQRSDPQNEGKVSTPREQKLQIPEVKHGKADETLYDWSDSDEDEEESQEELEEATASPSANATITSFVNDEAASEGLFGRNNGRREAVQGPREDKKSETSLPSAARLVEPFDPLDEIHSAQPHLTEGIRRNATVAGTDSRHNMRPRRPYSEAFDGFGRLDWDSFLQDTRCAPRKIPIRGPSDKATRHNVPIKRKEPIRSPFETNEEDRQISDCVRQLTDLGFLQNGLGAAERLQMYAQAARGDLVEAIDMIDEEERAYKERF